MRRSILALTLAAILSTSFGTPALAAPPASQSIVITGYASFNSILGGFTNGPATLSGDISNGELSGLRGTANLPLRDLSLTVTPETTIAVTTQQIGVMWNRYTCDPFGCTYTWGVSQFEFQRLEGPVSVRSGALHGNGRLYAQTTATCVADCPPAGSYWSAPSGSAMLSAALTSAREAGFVHVSGVTVDIR